jgi:hypothetical protein
MGLDVAGVNHQPFKIRVLNHRLQQPGPHAPVTGRQVGRSVVLVQWQEGRKVIVWPPEQRQGPLAYPWGQR